MINPAKVFNLSDYLEIFARRKWYVIVPFVIIMIAAASYAFIAPKKYLASTTILVTPQKVPTDFVRPTITARIEDRLQSIGQEIMSRTRLELIISEFRLYSDEAKSLTREEIIEKMREDIQVKIRGNEGYFTISYSGKDPRIVTMVANKLASLFIEENLKYREQLAQGTTEFLGVELAATKAKLIEQENAVTAFKRQFMNELPEQRDTNLSLLGKLQTDHQRISENLRSAQDRKLVIQKQLTEMKQMMASLQKMENPKEEKILPTASSPATEISSPSLPKAKSKNPNLIELDQLKKSLKDLQVKYTERHPDIQVTKKRIADLEKIIAADMPEGEREEEKVASASMKVSPPATPPREKTEEKNETDLFTKEMEGQLAANDFEIERLKREDANIRAKIVEYQKRVDNAPLRELTMIALSRDYNNTKETYQSLLRKNTESQTAESLERRQKGEQFKVIDPARIPEKPFKPNIPKIILMGFLAGIFCGFGLAFLKEQWDSSFKDAEDVEATLGLKVLVHIPKIEIGKA